MAELEQGLEELKVVKQAFKDNISANNVSTSNVEFRNMPELLKQMEKKLPTQTKSVEPTKFPQIIKADDGYKLEAVGVREIPSQYIIPTGTKEITENNEYDVTEVKKVVVAVKGTGTGVGGNPKFSQLIDGTISTLEETDLSEPALIKDYTFYYCTNMTSAIIPSNIVSIGESAFEGCSNLQTLILADGIASIGENAFKGINASVINIPSTISVLESGAFSNNTALTSVVIPNNVTELKDNVFSGCVNLTEVNMDSLTPPIVTDTTFPVNVNAIYVKYSAYESYLESWSNYADKIVRLPAIPSTIIINVNDYLGENVSGASVTITDGITTYTGTTDANGVFTQGDLQPATYTISVSDLNGYKTPESKEVVVLENTQNNVTITYLEKPSVNEIFGENTWEMINSVANEISANNMTAEQVYSTYGWNLGDTKTDTLSTGEVVEYQLIDYNHDDKSDGSGKAGITLQTKNCLNTTYVIKQYSLNIETGWRDDPIRTTHMKSIKATLSPELQSVIKMVDKKASLGKGMSAAVTSDDLFLLSEFEIFGKVDYAQDGTNEGTQYAYWALHNANADRIKYSNGTAIAWWERSSSKYMANYNAQVSKAGAMGTSIKNNAAGVSFAICI